jgi:hypothetical protein
MKASFIPLFMVTALFMGLLCNQPVLALPTCQSSGELNVTLTNSTPIMEKMTVDIVTSASPGTGCYLRIYDENTTILNIEPIYPRDTCGELNLIQSIMGDNSVLILSDAGTTHEDVLMAPWNFRPGYPYTLYVECGTYCDTTTFYVDPPRATNIERLAENIIFSLIDNPMYWVMAVAFLALIIFLLKELWPIIIAFILIPILPP